MRYQNGEVNYLHMELLILRRLKSLQTALLNIIKDYSKYHTSREAESFGIQLLMCP